MNNLTGFAVKSSLVSWELDSHPFVLLSVSTRLQTVAYNGLYESSENVYEDIAASKKKGKTDGGKKRKGPPKSRDSKTSLKHIEFVINIIWQVPN